MSQRVLITGATGFVGRFLTARLLQSGTSVRAVVRRSPPAGGALEHAVVGDIHGFTDWREALADVQTIVHLAARTHELSERGRGRLADYRPVNVDGTVRLAESAAEAGVRRMVFISSIKVNGERTWTHPFTTEDPPAPEDAYGVSKWEAEQALWGVAAHTGMEAVVVRPPLVYGRGSKGNFPRLCAAVRRGLPLPLGAVKNRRSLVSVQNLVDLVAVCLAHPAAAGRTFLVSDGEDLSTPGLIRRIAAAMGVTPRLIAVPPLLLRAAAKVTRKEAEIRRLTGSLQVDIQATRTALGWTPPLSVDEGLALAVSRG